jgi:hypothetical protein
VGLVHGALKDGFFTAFYIFCATYFDKVALNVEKQQFG